MYYSAIGLLAALILLIENQDLLFRPGGAFDTPAWRVYRGFLLTVFIYYITDILWGILEARKLAALLFADTTVYFVTMAAGILFWTQYTVTYLEEKSGFGRFLVAAGRGMAAAVTLLDCVNLFLPVLFTVDRNSVYSALPFRYAVLGCQILLLLLISGYALSVVMGRCGKETVGKYRTLALFGLIMAAFLFAQLWFPYLPLYAIAYLLGTCLLRAFVIADEKESYRYQLQEAERHRTVERMEEERAAHARINALAGDIICVYMVDPDTGTYREYSVSAGYEGLSLPRAGDGFFDAVRENGKRSIWPEDRDRFLAMFTRDRVLEEISHSGIFAMSCRMTREGKPFYVRVKASTIQEAEGARLVVGLIDIDTQVRQEEEHKRRLAQANNEANIDVLTGVKNRHAYLKTEEHLDHRIEEGTPQPFAIAVLDVNDLKKVNDEAGHQAGDQYLRDACKIICDIFKHSAVFRIGGDEFAALLQGEDYAHIEELTGRMADRNAQALTSGGIVVACGTARYDGDQCVAEVFARADKEMYRNKNALKAVGGAGNPA